MTPEYTPWMSEPFAWTGEAQDNASEFDPHVLELEDELYRRSYACALAEAWDQAHAEDAARQGRPHD